MHLAWCGGHRRQQRPLVRGPLKSFRLPNLRVSVPCFYFYRAPVFTYPTYLSLRGDACDGPCIRIQSSQPTLGDNVENNINSFFCTLPA